MKERLITLACALGALVLFIAMFVQRETGLERRNEVPRPTATERRGNGYNAAVSWLEAEGIRTTSLRERFDKLGARHDMPQRGNLLIVTLPSTTGFRTEEFVPLDRWVRAGNTLLVLAALSDNPDWAFALGGLAPGDLNLLTGLEFETTRARAERERRNSTPPAQRRTRAARSTRGDDVASADPAGAFQAYAQPQRSVLVARRPHVYFTGVREAVALSDYPRQLWTVKVPYEGFVLALGREATSGEGALWTRPLGAGRIIVSGFGTLFTNRALGLADNAQLFANIVAANLARNGVVLFDDIHQGIAAGYDPDKFYSDPRLYITLAVLGTLWLVWVLGSTRLRVPSVRVSSPREQELVQAT